MTPLLPKKSDFKQQAPAAHQPWRSAVLTDVSRRMGNFSFMHQTHPSAASRKEKTQSLAHPEQSKGGGKRFPPASSSPGQRSCWKMVSSGRRGEGKAALSSRGFPWWGSTVAGYSLWDGASRCPGHPCPARCHLGWGGLLNHSVQAGDAKLTQHPTQSPGVPGTDCTP